MPPKRKFNKSAYVNRGVDANRSEWLDEEGAREVAEGMEMPVSRVQRCLGPLVAAKEATPSSTSMRVAA